MVQSRESEVGYGEKVVQSRESEVGDGVFEESLCQIVLLTSQIDLSDRQIGGRIVT